MMQAIQCKLECGTLCKCPKLIVFDACVSLQLVLPELIATLYSLKITYNLPLAVYAFTPSIPSPLPACPPSYTYYLWYYSSSERITQNIAVLGR